MCSVFVIWGIGGLAAEPDLKKNSIVEAKSAKVSVFEKDESGVLWFVKGEGDKETEYSASLDLSAVTDGIVITVISDTERLGKAVGLAIKMRTALHKNQQAPEQIFIVAFETDKKAVGYRFYTDGIAAGGKENESSTYGPKEAKTKLGDILNWWVVLQDMVKRGEWGKDQEGISALRVVKR